MLRIRRLTALNVVVFISCLLFFRAAAPESSALNRVQAITGDKPLTATDVNGWFDQSIGRPITQGNEVTELVDGYRTFNSMSDVIKTTRPNLSVLYNLGSAAGDGLYPSTTGNIAEGRDHCIYFTTGQGGANNRGAFCKMTPDGKTEVKYSFDLVHGADPRGGVTLGSDGNFYGTCYAGGKFSAGTLWKMTANGGISVIWDFRNGAPLVTTRPQTEQEKMDAAGSYPISPPVQAKNGGWYGITSYANNQQFGVVYQIGGPGIHALYQFKPADVAELGTFGSSMTAGSDGNLYGTTVKGGLGWGTVFKCGPGGGISTIHKFDAVNGQGAISLIQGKDGYLYGTASGGGGGLYGLVYKLSTSGSEYKVIHTFMGLDGALPVSSFSQAKDGFLYGTTKGGGSGGRGVIYRIAPSGDYFTVVHSFALSMLEGRYSYTAPIQHSNGYLYGITGEGGSKGGGVLYRVEMMQPDFVFTLNWWMTDSFPLYGPNTPSVFSLFTEASNRGVQVRAMLWDQYGTQNNDEISHINAMFNGAAILDNRTLDYGSHHQKILVVNGPDGLTAFCGGLDFNPDRVASVANDPGSYYHDVHCKIKGPATKDLLQIFVDRWNDHPDHVKRDAEKTPLPVSAVLTQVPIPNATCTVQIGRTFGNGTRYPQLGTGGPYSFAPNGEHTAASMIINAINHAKKFIYVEEQYFVDTAPNIPGLDVRGALVKKLKDPNFQKLIVLIPHGSITDMGAKLCGVTLVTNQVNYRRRLLISALKAAGGDKFQIFYLNRPGDSHTYVHAKTWIFDDQFAIIGSANCNRRSWTHDSEVVAGICDQGKPDGSAYLLPHRLRMRLWAEHLSLGNYVNGVYTGYEDKLKDPIDGFKYWVAPPAGLRSQYAHALPYTDIVAETNHPDSDWNKYADPDGS